MKRGGAWHTQFKRSSKEQRTDRDGITHDSVEEMERWAKLKLDQQLGLIRNLCRQVPFEFVIDVDRSVKTPTGRVMKYTADFCYDKLINGEWVEIIEEYKGFLDEVSKMRIAIFEAIYRKKVYIKRR